MTALQIHHRREHDPRPLHRKRSLQVPERNDSGWRLDRRYSETTAERIDDGVRELIETAFDRAASVLKERRATLDKAAEVLLAKETLTGEELKVLFGGERSDTAESVPAVATSPLSS
jgi:cell division protease FtsH